MNAFTGEAKARAPSLPAVCGVKRGPEKYFSFVLN
jgi:hypothetical protein